MIVVNSVDEIPSFATEREEQAYWCSHTFGPAMWEPTAEGQSVAAWVRERIEAMQAEDERRG